MALADGGRARHKGVNPAADAQLEGATRTLIVGADIFIGDLVETGPKGQVQILFADNTKLVVGPQSSLKIDDYLMRNNGAAGKFAVDMLSGSFRFATGNGPKNQVRDQHADRHHRRARHRVRRLRRSSPAWTRILHLHRHGDLQCQ